MPEGLKAGRAKMRSSNWMDLSFSRNGWDKVISTEGQYGDEGGLLLPTVHPFLNVFQIFSNLNSNKPHFLLESLCQLPSLLWTLPFPPASVISNPVQHLISLFIVWCRIYAFLPSARHGGHAICFFWILHNTSDIMMVMLKRLNNYLLTGSRRKVFVCHHFHFLE